MSMPAGSKPKPAALKRLEGNPGKRRLPEQPVGTWDDLWLPREADKNPNAAVNVSKSAELARQSGIRRVVVVRDTGRHPLDKLRLSRTGSPIFPSAGIPPAVQGRSALRHRVGRQRVREDPGGRRQEASATSRAP
jgi:hypothetical protein